MTRLPYFLTHYRKLGVGHFLFVDNDSDDGSREFLAEQSDVSLWHTSHSYKASRFGVDWTTWLQIKYGHGHWCLCVDADELLIYPYHDTRNLNALTDWLDAMSRRSFGALMLDMYPKGRVSQKRYAPGEDPMKTLCWFDAGNYTIQYKDELKRLSIQGGPRARLFFSSQPHLSPHLTKIPLVKWNRRYVFAGSTHTIFPPRLNVVYDTKGGEMTSGVLLHTKFLNIVSEKSREEKSRREHFTNSDLYDDYYDALQDDPDLWCAKSTRYLGWRQLESIGLMSKGGWY